MATRSHPTTLSPRLLCLTAAGSWMCKPAAAVAGLRMTEFRVNSVHRVLLLHSAENKTEVKAAGRGSYQW